MTSQDDNPIPNDLSVEEMVQLRKELTKTISKKRTAHHLFIQTKIPDKWIDSFNEAKEWAHNKGLIERPSKWSFAKFCISNTIRMCLDQKDMEETPDVATAVEYPEVQLSEGYHEEPNIVDEESEIEDIDIIKVHPANKDEEIEEEDKIIEPDEGYVSTGIPDL